MPMKTLIAADDLARALASPHPPHLLDCRFDLGDPAAGRAAWEAGHLTGAVHAHLDDDLSGPKHGADGRFRGRHPLPARERFAATLGAWGVDRNTPVVAYDGQGGMYAARAWWLLRWLGHTDVAVLDGGIAAWTASGGPLVTDTPPLVAQPPYPISAPGLATLDVGAVNAGLGRLRLTMYTRILVPTDGSDITSKAVQTALGLAKPDRRRVVRHQREGALPLQRHLRDAAGAAAGVLRRAGAHRRRHVKAVTDAASGRRGLQRATPSRRCTPGRRSSTTPRPGLRPDRDGLARPPRRVGLAAGQRDPEGADAQHLAGADGEVTHPRAAAALAWARRGRLPLRDQDGQWACCGCQLMKGQQHQPGRRCHPAELGQRCRAMQAALQLRHQVGHGHVDEAAGRHHQQVGKQRLPGPDHEVAQHAAGHRGQARQGVVDSSALAR
jgi:rhodanese-related sulfurtransferase